MTSSSHSPRGENESSLDACQQQTSSFASKSNNTTTTTTTVSSSSSASAAAVASNSSCNVNSSINLTSNPMSSVCTTPRATIVVQQVRINFSNFPLYSHL